MDKLEALLGKFATQLNSLTSRVIALESTASAHQPSGVDLNFASPTQFVNSNNKRVRFAQSTASDAAPVAASASSSVQVVSMDEDITPSQQVSRLKQMESRMNDAFGSLAQLNSTMTSFLNRTFTPYPPPVNITPGVSASITAQPTVSPSNSPKN